MKWPPINAQAALAKRRREKLTGLPGAYYFAPIVQAPAAPPVRRCVRCGVRVENPNLGGHGRAAVLFGPLWCLRCADGRPLQ